MFITPMAAHQQAQAGDRDRDQSDHAGDAVELLDDLVRRGDGEIVGARPCERAYAAHHAFDLVVRLLAFAGLGFWRLS